MEGQTEGDEGMTDSDKSFDAGRLRALEDAWHASATHNGASFEFIGDGVGLIPEDPPRAEVVPTSDTSRKWLAVAAEAERHLDTLPPDLRPLAEFGDYVIDEEAHTVTFRAGQTELGTWTTEELAYVVHRYFDAAGWWVS